MNVHITCTTDFPEEQLTKIVSLLNSISGELIFQKSEIWTEAKFSSIDRRFYNIDEINSLTFEEYFHLVKAYRNFTPGINGEDFVILISKIKHDKEWFSAFERRNIFVHGAEWELYSDADPIYGIAYQCVENIFQSLLNLDIINYKKEPNIHHEKSLGCINDFCREKEDILTKLRTADICEACLQRAEKEGVDPRIIDQIGGIIELIRQAFISKRKNIGASKLKVIDIDSSANVKIGSFLFNPVGEIPKLLFIYFLKHPEGIDSKNLCSKKDEFLRIYKIIKENGGNSEPNKNTIKTYEITIESLCCQPDKKNFRTYKSRLNSELEKLLGVELAMNYQINSTNLGDRNYLFKINLNHDYLNIDPRF